MHARILAYPPADQQPSRLQNIDGWRIAAGNPAPGSSGSVTPRCPTTASSPDGCYNDSFLTRLAPDGRSIIYSTYLHANDPNSFEFVRQVAVDAQGRATVVGFTSGEGLPLRRPIQGAINGTPCNITSPTPRFCYDGFISTFAPDGGLIFSTYHGGSGDDQPESVAIGPDGSLYITGSTRSGDFPLTSGARQGGNAGGSDWFVSRISSPGGAPSHPPASALPFKAFLPLIIR